MIKGIKNWFKSLLALFVSIFRFWIVSLFIIGKQVPAYGAIVKVVDEKIAKGVFGINTNTTIKALVEDIWRNFKNLIPFTKKKYF